MSKNETRVETRDQLEEWFQQARRGDRALYHVGRLYDDRDNADVASLANAAYKLSQQKKALLTQRLVHVCSETPERVRKIASDLMQQYLRTGRDLRAITEKIAYVVRREPMERTDAYHYEYLITKA